MDKKFFEQHFRLHNKLTIYSKDGIKLTITNSPECKTETVTVENNPLDPAAGTR